MYRVLSLRLPDNRPQTDSSIAKLFMLERGLQPGANSKGGNSCRPKKK